MDINETVQIIRRKALQMRVDAIEMGFAAGKFGGHFGPALCCIDALATLYFGVMRHDPKNPLWPGRDRFVLSKGHACLALYAALAEAGYFPKSEMTRFKSDETFLSGHPGNHPEYGVEIVTGSLGNGFAVAAAMALAAKVKGESHKVYCVLGDGECNEGLVWEAAMNAAKNKLGNLITIVDRNGFQLAGHTKEIMDIDLEAIWRAFGWDVSVVPDGNDPALLLPAILAMRDSAVERPHLIISDTVKGKGVSFMEHNLAWHAGALSQEQYDKAMSELAAAEEGI